MRGREGGARRRRQSKIKIERSGRGEEKSAVEPKKKSGRGQGARRALTKEGRVNEGDKPRTSLAATGPACRDALRPVGVSLDETWGGSLRLPLHSITVGACDPSAIFLV